MKSEWTALIVRIVNGFTPTPQTEAWLRKHVSKAYMAGAKLRSVKALVGAELDLVRRLNWATINALHTLASMPHGEARADLVRQLRGWLPAVADYGAGQPRRQVGKMLVRFSIAEGISAVQGIIEQYEFNVCVTMHEYYRRGGRQPSDFNNAMVGTIRIYYGQIIDAIYSERGMNRNTDATPEERAYAEYMASQALNYIHVTRITLDSYIAERDAFVLDQFGTSYDEMPVDIQRAFNDRFDKWTPMIERSCTLWGQSLLAMAVGLRVMLDSDRNMRWTLGTSITHCQSCLKLSGKVKRGSFWIEQGILPAQPNSWFLDCGGWQCHCNLLTTNERGSPGRLPKLP